MWWICLWRMGIRIKKEWCHLWHLRYSHPSTVRSSLDVVVSLRKASVVYKIENFWKNKRFNTCWLRKGWYRLSFFFLPRKKSTLHLSIETKQDHCWCKWVCNSIRLQIWGELNYCSVNILLGILTRVQLTRSDTWDRQVLLTPLKSNFLSTPVQRSFQQSILLPLLLVGYTEQREHKSVRVKAIQSWNTY